MMTYIITLHFAKLCVVIASGNRWFRFWGHWYHSGQIHRDVNHFPAIELRETGWKTDGNKISTEERNRNLTREKKQVESTTQMLTRHVFSRPPSVNVWDTARLHTQKKVGGPALDRTILRARCEASVDFYLSAPRPSWVRPWRPSLWWTGLVKSFWNQTCDEISNTDIGPRLIDSNPHLRSTSELSIIKATGGFFFSSRYCFLSAVF